MNDTQAREDVSVEVLLGQVADEFTQRLNSGQQPDLEEYVARFPQIAELLRQILPALQLIRVPALAPVPTNGPSTREDPLAGCLGDFRILREIGRGGMGVVYEAEQLSLGRRVALKVLPFAAAMDPKQLQRFKNESQAAAHLQHQHIVPVHYVGCERGVHFYAMQYIEGQTLAAVIGELRQLADLDTVVPVPAAEAASALASELVSGRWAPVKRKDGEVARPCGREQPTGPYLPSAPAFDPTPPVASLSTERSTKSPAFFRTLAHLGVQAAEALEYAHQMGVIHRDIKPANLLIDAGGRLWVTDFGLAHCQSQPGLTMTGDLVGTLRYMSPEQALAKRIAVDARTDVYSLGVTLYELLTLEPAYNGHNREELLRQIAFEEPQPPSRWNKAVPAELETISLKAMAKNPEERYATAQELADDLRRFLEDKPIKAKRPTLWQRVSKWARRHKTVVRAALVVLVLAMVALSASTWLILAAYRAEAKERQSAVTALYHSYVGEAETIRQARGGGYRLKAWQRLRAALRLETPEKDLNELRQQAVACMGDFVGFEPKTWTDFSADITAIALHPNGAQLAIGLKDGTVLLRDLGTGEVLGHLERHPGSVTALALAPDGVRLVSGDTLGTLRLWTANADGRWAQTRTIFPGHGLVRLLPDTAFLSLVPQFDDPTLECIAVSPDGKQLAACIGGVFSDLAPAITLWNLSDGSRIATLFREPRLERYCRLAFSPDGKLLASSYSRRKADGVSVDFGVMLWSLDKGEVSQDHPSDLWRVHEVVFSPDGKLLACGCEEGVALYEGARPF